ncbi:TIR domain-containing protein [Paenibacillus sp. LMG 31460]|uniref:TIR domain-containing protein n=1 Tax=Paenibacillus germinis TaxID=2654979 RepID=A0ABX1ZCU7_9BACL|nr:toll/interleukin-1 receptor domain-containing protein [Paenibacillus germinis]NOU91158.1 TIR domain-containing protein [Paenibacillus germinis]
MLKTINMFISYSRKDLEYKIELEKHLSILIRRYGIEVWSDKELKVGDFLDKEIEERLEKADIVILLISSDFFASYYCYEKEFKNAYEKQIRGDARIIPILVRPCSWKLDEYFIKFLVFPQDGTSISEYENKDKAYLEIVEQMCRNIEEYNKSKLSIPENIVPIKVDSDLSSTQNISIISRIDGLSDRYNTIYMTNLDELETSSLIMDNIKLEYINNVPESRLTENFNDLMKMLFMDSKNYNLIIDVIACICSEANYLESSISIYLTQKKIQDLLNFKVKNFMDENPIYFSNDLSKITYLFFKCPGLYSKLSDSSKLDIHLACKKHLNYYLLSCFINENLSIHLDKSFDLLDSAQKNYYLTHNWVNTNDIPNFEYKIVVILIRNASTSSDKKALGKFVLKLISNSYSFYTSSSILNDLLPIAIEIFNEEDCINMLKHMDKNSQFYDLGKYSNGRHSTLSHRLLPFTKELNSKINGGTQSVPLENYVL